VATESKGRDLFIVDNSVSAWTARYLEEWSGIAKAFDIATGYFEIGALLALDKKWQPLEKIRILMGAETTHRTRKVLLEAVRSRAAEILDRSIEADKEANPFLHGVPAILEALKAGRGWAALGAAQQRIVDSLIRDARMSGVGLDGETHERFNAIQTELATNFSNHVLNLTKAFELTLTDQAKVEGLSSSLLELAAHSAREAGDTHASAEAGPWRITLDAPSFVPFVEHWKP
jgi:Zn-dependent oligopeptidase